MAYDILANGSRARLAKLRRYAEKWNADPRKQTKIDLWRARSFGVAPVNDNDSGGASAKRDAWPVSVTKGWRDAGDVSAIFGSRHGGWYADDCQDEVYTGRVWQLPARNGEPQYLAGYIETGADYAVFVATARGPELFDDKESAGRAADRLAERNARREREHSERWREAVELDDRIAEKCGRCRAIRAKHNEALRGWIDAIRARAGIAAAALLSDVLTARELFAEAAAELRELRKGLEQFADVDR